MPSKTAANTQDSDIAPTHNNTIQAVVLADSFATHFAPITHHAPKMLMPVVNVPVIEYTLEFLASGGVDECFVFCCAHADMLRDYIRKSQLHKRLASMALHVLVARSACYSPGDALREIEAMGVITSDFVLVPGDVVANLPLAPILEAHKSRRELDRDAVLTTLMKRLPPQHRARRAGEAALVALSGETGRLLLFEEASRRGVVGHKLELPTALLQETDRLQLHQDLYDTHIDICAPELLVLLQDNFDWQDLRRDLLPGVLGQFEMLGKTIYTHVLTREYAARVHDPYTYDAVCRDIVGRWAHPLSPDANLLPGLTYRCGRDGVYKEQGVALARSVSVSAGCVLGAGTHLDGGARVHASTLGRGCHVGAGATVAGSYLWEGVRVGEGASIHGAICAANVAIGRDAVVPTGCVLGEGVVVPAGVALPPFSRWSARGADELRAAAEEMGDDDTDGSDTAGDDEDNNDRRRVLLPLDPADVSAALPAAAAADSELAASVNGISLDAAAAPHDPVAAARLDPASLAALEAAAGSSGACTLYRIAARPSSIGYRRPLVSEGPIANELSEAEEEEMEEAAAQEFGERAAFADEVKDTLLRAIDQGHTVDNVALEVNSLKFAQVRSFAECVSALVPALLGSLSLAKAATKKERKMLTVQGLERWGELIKRFVQSGVEEDALVAALVELSAEYEEAVPDIFVGLLLAHYEVDLLPEEAIFRWADDAAAAPPGSFERKLHAQSQEMLQWLREAETEESSDEDEHEEPARPRAS